jgi:ATP-binding cassette subfamily B protein
MSDLYFEEEEFTSQFNGQIIKRIAQQAQPYWKWVLSFLLLIGMVSLQDAVFTYLSKMIIDEGIVAGNRARLIQLITIYASMIIVQASGVFGFIYLAANLGERIQYDLRRKMFNHLQALSFSYFDKTPVGWIMSRVTSDAGRIADLITWGLIDTTWATLNLTVSLVFMFIINWQLALVMALILPILIVIAAQFQKRILTAFRQVRKLNSKLTGVYNENITGVRVVKALTREEKNLQEFDGLASSLYRSAYRAAWLSALFLPTVQIVGAMALGAIVWYGGCKSPLAG